MGYGRFFHIIDDGKLKIFNMQKKFHCRKTTIFIESTEIIWNGKDTNFLIVYILLKDMGWYLVVIENLQNNKYMIYILVGEVLNGTLSIFNKLHYHCWYTIMYLSQVLTQIYYFLLLITV